MKITQWGVEVTSKKTRERDVALWSDSEIEAKEYFGWLKDHGRKDAALVERVIERADPAPIINVDARSYPRYGSSGASPVFAGALGGLAGFVIGETLQ